MEKTTKLKLGASVAAAVVIVLIVVTVLTRYEFYAATLKYGLILLCILIVAFLVWKAFIKNGRKDLKRSEKKGEELQAQIAELQGTIRDLSRELAEKNRSRLNVVDLNPILHVAVMKIDTSFTRTYVREENEMTFNGALRADICAEYGIRLEDVRFRYDEMGNTLHVANFTPGLISFSKKQLTWDIARSYRTRHIFGLELSAVSDASTDTFTKAMCEQLRTDLEREIDERSISEFDWLSPMVSGQVVDFLRILVGKEGVTVAISESCDDSFVDLPSLRQQLVAVSLPAAE